MTSIPPIFGQEKPNKATITTNRTPQTKQFPAQPRGNLFFFCCFLGLALQALKPVPWGQKVSGILDDAGEWLKVKAGSSLDLKTSQEGFGEDDWLMINLLLGGGFKYSLFSPLPGEDSQFD